MTHNTPILPDPAPESVAFWLSQLDRATLHGEGWQEVNRRFHSIARAARPFIREQYPEPADQEAFFDGLTLALLTMGHFADVNELAARLRNIQANGPERKSAKPKASH
jgi:hypothetical protein